MGASAAQSSKLSLAAATMAAAAAARERHCSRHNADAEYGAEVAHCLATAGGMTTTATICSHYGAAGCRVSASWPACAVSMGLAAKCKGGRTVLRQPTLGAVAAPGWPAGV